MNFRSLNSFEVFCTIWLLQITFILANFLPFPTIVPGANKLIKKKEFPYDYWKPNSVKNTNYLNRRISFQNEEHYSHFYGNEPIDNIVEDYEALPIQLPDDLVGGVDTYYSWTKKDSEQKLLSSVTPQYGRHPGSTDPLPLYKRNEYIKTQTPKVQSKLNHYTIKPSLKKLKEKPNSKQKPLIPGDNDWYNFIDRKDHVELYNQDYDFYDDYYTEGIQKPADKINIKYEKPPYRWVKPYHDLTKHTFSKVGPSLNQKYPQPPLKRLQLGHNIPTSSLPTGPPTKMHIPNKQKPFKDMHYKKPLIKPFITQHKVQHLAPTKIKYHKPPQTLVTVPPRNVHHIKLELNKDIQFPPPLLWQDQKKEPFFNQNKDHLNREPLPQIEDPIDRITTSLGTSSVVVPGGMVLMGLALAVFYFNFIWYPTPVVRARFIEMMSRVVDGGNLNQSHQRAIGQVYEALLNMDLDNAAKELWSPECRNRIVCQAHHEFPSLWQVTRNSVDVINKLFFNSNDHIDKKYIGEYLQAAVQGNTGESCMPSYPKCQLPEIPIKSTLRKLLGIDKRISATDVHHS